MQRPSQICLIYIFPNLTCSCAHIRVIHGDSTELIIHLTIHSMLKDGGKILGEVDEWAPLIAGAPAVKLGIV